MTSLTNGTTNGHAGDKYLPSNSSLFFGGSFHEPKDGEYREVLSAATGHVITKVAFAGRNDTVAALEAANKAFDSWRIVSTLERCNLLRKLANLVREHAEELAMLDAWNIGSPIAVMRAEVEYAAMNLELFAGLVPAVTGETYRLTEDMSHFTIREPIGVVARILAYNHPFLLVAAKMATAIAVGNTIVLKPSEQAPLSALRFAELIQGVVPPGVVNILVGGRECGETLSSHPIVQKITLVGSVPIGRAIARAAADTLKTVVLELGGKNALVAYPDSNIPQLVDGIVKGMNWAWCGQSCSSTSRVFLHESIHDEVVDLVIKKLKTDHIPGDPRESTTTMGALVDGKALERTKKYIEVAKSEGAKLACGGTRPTELPESLKDGFYMLPTIFTEVKQTMRIAQEEVFGPVMSILKWTDENEMWTQVNSVEYGLTGAVYSANGATAQRGLKRMQAGYVWVNTSASHYLGLPFGGYKQSGMGREHDLQELYDMTQVKTVHMSLQ
jgi:betaine-aldehyde dehydrogenase